MMFDIREAQAFLRAFALPGDRAFGSNNSIMIEYRRQVRRTSHHQ
jgi:hypothetical protein